MKCSAVTFNYDIRVGTRDRSIRELFRSVAFQAALFIDPQSPRRWIFAELNKAEINDERLPVLPLVSRRPFVPTTVGRGRGMG